MLCLSSLVLYLDCLCLFMCHSYLSSLFLFLYKLSLFLYSLSSHSTLPPRISLETSVICWLRNKPEMSEYFFQDRIRIRIYSFRQFSSEYEYEYIRIVEKVFEYIRILKYIRIFEYIRIFQLKHKISFV